MNGVPGNNGVTDKKSNRPKFIATCIFTTLTDAGLSSEMPNLRFVALFFTAPPKGAALFHRLVGDSPIGGSLSVALYNNFSQYPRESPKGGI